MKKDTKSLLWGALVGSVVGSVTALLFAPKPGKELRKDIAEGTASGLEKVQEIAVQAGDKTVELYDNAKDTIEHVVHEVREWSKSCVHVIDEEEEQLVVSGITSEEVAVTVEDISESAEALNSEEAICEETSSEEEITSDDVQDNKDNNEIV